jgi:periplasmic divalent cation tolerance protein
MIDFVLTYATFPDSELAAEVAESLVSRGLVACVNIFPEVKSIYKWMGEVEESKEVVMIAKTKKDLFNKVKDVILEMHSYDTPAIIAIDIMAGDEKFLKWVEKETINS